MHLTNLLGMQNKLGAFFEFSLLDLILPLVNLSVSDPNKGLLSSQNIKRKQQNKKKISKIE